MINLIGKIPSRLLDYARHGWLAFFATILSGLFGGIFIVLQSFILSRIIAGVHLSGWDLKAADASLWLFILVLTGRFFCIWAGEAAAGSIAVRVKNTLRRDLLEKMERLGPIGLAGEQSGEITSILSQGLDGLDGYFNQFLPQVILAAVIPFCVLVGVFPLDWLSGLILLITAPLLPIFMILIGGAAEKITRRQWSALGRMSAQFLEILQGLKTLKAFNQARAAGEKVGEISRQYRVITLQVMRLTFLSALVLELVSTLSVALVAVQIGLKLLDGGIQFEQALFILVVAPDFYLPLRQLGLRFHAAASGISAARRIFEFLSLPEPAAPAGKRSYSGKWIWKEAPEIVLDHVSVRYPGQKEDVLTDIDLHLERGKVTAVVGRSGSGKTTMGYLFLGLLSPTKGRIVVDGLPLSAAESPDWRNGIAWVGQNPTIFHGSLAENLRMGKKDLTDQQLWETLELCGMAGWIRALPAVLATQVGESGVSLSSGQKQRLAVCRAILRNPRLVILDEPTAHLDVLGEDDLLESLKILMKDRTVFIVAHRLPTLQLADQVAYLEKGRMMALGSPEQLVSTSVNFRKMIRAYQGVGEN